MHKNNVFLIFLSILTINNYTQGNDLPGQASILNIIKNKKNLLKKLQDASYPDTGNKIPQKDLPIICWTRQDSSVINWIKKALLYIAPENQRILAQVAQVAKGKNVSEIINYGTSKEIKECVRAIGAATGSFHQAFMDYVNPESPETWTTASLYRSDNQMFFDYKSAQVYAVDNKAEIGERRNIQSDIIQAAIYLYNPRHAKLIAFNFIKGYIESFPEANKKRALASYFMHESALFNLWNSTISQKTRYYLDTIFCANSKPEDHFTPLEVAIAQGNAEKVKALVHAGADINQINTSTKEHTSPLIVAIKADDGDENMTDLLYKLNVSLKQNFHEDQKYAIETLKKFINDMTVFIAQGA